MASIILAGDVNLMNVADAGVPFRRVADRFAAADLVFCNLECCLYEAPGADAVEVEGFFADPVVAGQCLTSAGIAAVGLANNVNYGSEPILGSIARLDALGIAHTGAGADRTSAAAPAIVERGGIRVGFLARSSVFWATNHEATAKSAGIAVIRGHTAYHVPMHKMKREVPPLNRPGIPPYILTWADADYLKRFAEDVAALRPKVDVLVASCHWGLHKDVLAYMTEIAHAAIDAGADVVIGHGPHYSLGIEVYKGRPIFHGLGSFSFHTGHGGHAHGDWIGMMAKLDAGNGGVTRAAFEFVRHNAANETVVCDLAAEAAEYADIAARSAAMGAVLRAEGNEVVVALR